MDSSKMLYSSEGYWIADIAKLPNDAPNALIEKYEGMVVVDFVPTSENLTRWIFDIVQERMRELNVKVESVEFWETPKSHCKVVE